jgi:hypothetical protein
MKSINISLEGVPKDYALSLLPLIIQNLGYTIQWTRPSIADLKIIGPFYQAPKKKNLIPKPLRPFFCSNKEQLSLKNGATHTVSLFHTQENVRHNQFKTDYSISFDLGIFNKNHFRLPYWMEMIDWSHEGIKKNINPRYGRLLSLQRLMEPLGNRLNHRLSKAAFITSHLNEPRKLLFDHINSFLPIDGYGPYFDKNIRSHLQSSFTKYDVLQKYNFNLCPENSLYPGYITEKIPEAFYAGCIPLTWVDANVACDFNPLAMINLMPMVHQDFDTLKELLNAPHQLEKITDQSLIIQPPSLEPLKTFVLEILRQASS